MAHVGKKQLGTFCPLFLAPLSSVLIRLTRLLTVTLPLPCNDKIVISHQPFSRNRKVNLGLAHTFGE